MNSTRRMICCLAALGAVTFGMGIGSRLRAEQDVANFLVDDPAHRHDDHDHDHVHHRDHNLQVLDRQKASFQRHLSVRMNELKRACELEEKQVKKLEVAAKGAIEEVMKQYLQRFPQLNPDQAFEAAPQIAPPAAALAIANPIQRAAALDLQIEALQAVPAQPAEAVVDADPQLDVVPQPDAEIVAGEAADPVELPAPPVDLPQQAFAQVFVAPNIAPAPVVWNMHQNFQMEPSEVANTLVWRNAVQGVLTDAQKEAYRKSQTDRRMFKRQMVVDRIVASVDRRLFLSNQQRKELAKVIHDVIGDNLDHMVPHGGFTSDAMVAAQVVGQLPREKLEGVLEAAQLEGWNDLQQVQHGVVFGLR